MYTRYCISCGESFQTILEEAVLCPDCGGEKVILPDQVVELPQPVLPAGVKAPSRAGATAEGDWQKGKIILGTYEVKEIFTSGGMGLVYQVRHLGWNIDLALKSPRPEIIEKYGEEDFIREANTWVELGLHPHIVSCYYVRKIDNFPRVFAEFVEGGSLKDWIEDRRLYGGGEKRSIERILDIAIQFTWGLAYAHEKGLVHQDVKPANVLLMVDGADEMGAAHSQNPTAKVSDFGLAKARAASGDGMSPHGNTDGPELMVSAGGYTPAYCSPEQARGQKLSLKTDIWSWAVSLLEMFTGEVTWYSGTAALDALEEYLENGSPNARIPKMTGGLADLLRLCLQNAPERRPQDMLEVARRLHAIYQQETGQFYPRQMPKTTELGADSLNNQALSFLDLGKIDQARRCWDAALQADPQHLVTIYNFHYSRWKWGEIAGCDLLNLLKEELEKTHLKDPHYWRLVGWIYLEQGDLESIQDLLDQHLIDDQAFMQAFLAKQRPVGRLLRRFEGHTDTVNAVCFTPDGLQFVSGSTDHTLRLWDVKTGQEIHRFEDPGWIGALCVSPDGRFVLTGGGDQILRLRDLQTGEVLRQFGGHTGQVNSACISPDGRLLLSGSDDATLRLWVLNSGQELKRFEGHKAPIASVDISPDNRLALSGGADKTLRLWNLSSGREIRRFEGHTQKVNCVRFSPDGRTILSACGDMNTAPDDNSIRLWDVDTGHERYRRPGVADEIQSICFSPDGRFALSGNLNLSYIDERNLQLWDLENGREIRRFVGNWLSLEAVCFSPDGRYALSGGGDNCIILWELYFPEQHWEVQHPYPILSRAKPIVELISDQERAGQLSQRALNAIKSGSYSQAYQLLRQAQAIPGFERDRQILTHLTECGRLGKAVRSGKPNVWERNKIRTKMVYVGGVSIAVSPDDQFFLGAVDYAFSLWDLQSGKQIRKFEGHTAHVNSVAFSPNGRQVLSASSDCSLRLWDVATGREVQRFSNHRASINAACFSTDGQFALSGSSDKTMRLWDLVSKKEIHCFEGHTGAVEAVCFSPNGLFALSGTMDSRDSRSLRLWDLTNGREVTRFNEKMGLVSSVSVSPRNDLVVSTTINGVRVWDLASGNEVRRLQCGIGLVGSAGFTPDGSFLLSGDEEGVLRLWDVTQGVELLKLKAHKEQISSVCFSASGRYALSGSEDDTIRLWEFDWDWDFPT
jgi:WD40 repeat protein/serine/threonine protein kinase